MERGRELSTDNKLIAKALSRKASVLLELAGCAGDYAPAIRALEQSLAEHYSEETLKRLVEVESERKSLELKSTASGGAMVRFRSSDLARRRSRMDRSLRSSADDGLMLDAGCWTTPSNCPFSLDSEKWSWLTGRQSALGTSITLPCGIELRSYIP